MAKAATKPKPTHSDVAAAKCSHIQPYGGDTLSALSAGQPKLLAISFRLSVDETELHG
jgi:hypothetical protein